MNCTSPIMHTIVAGDTLYRLAIRFDTTVEDLLELNPGIDVYNLRIGSNLTVCPGPNHYPPITTPVPPIETVPPITQPVPPIGTLPPVDALRELLLMVLRWIRQHFGDQHANRIIEVLCSEWQNPNNQ